MQLGMHGPEYGLNGLTVEQLPSPAARFACNPLVSGADGGHDIHLRDLGRRRQHHRRLARRQAGQPAQDPEDGHDASRTAADTTSSCRGSGWPATKVSARQPDTT